MGESGRVLVWVLAFIAAAGIGFAALIGIGCAIGANSCPFGKNEPITATDGRALFESQCMACHGPQGEGTRNAPSLVSGAPGSLTAEQLRAKIGRGKPLAGMPAFKRSLNEQQIDAVATYVLTLRGNE